MDQKSAFPIVQIEGPPVERGIQYGNLAGEQIAVGLALYREAFSNTGVGWPEARTIAAELMPLLDDYDSDMAAELSGIAQGAEVAPEDVFILNARTEILHRRHGRAARRDVGTMDECTSLVALPAVTDCGDVLHGQNWDWNPKCKDSAIVLHIRFEDGPDILTFAEAGQLARSGMNSAGIALTANGLQASNDNLQLGTPSPFVRRRLLMQSYLATAIGAVLNAEISSSHNLAISHRGGEAFQLEVTPGEAFWLEHEGGFLTHANHFKSQAARAKLEDIGLTRCPESLYRDGRTRSLANAAKGNVNEATFKSIFSDRYGTPHAILRAPAIRQGGNLSGTVASIIMNTTKGQMQVANSPYCGDPVYSQYSLDVA